MRVTDSFRDFVLDQLSDVRGLRARPMFGGIGLYAFEVFFGILAADVLYFKVDETNRSDYLARGSRPFMPYVDQSVRQVTMPYYEVPLGVLEDGATLVAWAHRSIDVANRSRVRARPAHRKR